MIISDFKQLSKEEFDRLTEEEKKVYLMNKTFRMEIKPVKKEVEEDKK